VTRLPIDQLCVWYQFSGENILKIKLVGISLLMLSSAAMADGSSCGKSAVQLLADGQVKEVAAMFGQSPVEADLNGLLQVLGKISEIEVVNGPWFKSHKRLSVKAAGLALAYSYSGVWVNARSDKLGPVQLHIAVIDSATCKLAAIHVDYEPK
jgi:hypothetical protein